MRVLGDKEPAITTVSDLISTQPDEQGLPVQVDAWVKNVRKSSAVRFLDIGDGSCSAPLQAVVDKELVKSQEYVMKCALAQKILC